MRNIDFLKEDYVSIWYLNIREDAGYYNFLYSLLSEDEKQKAGKFKFQNDRVTSVLARGSLRLLLSKQLDCNAKDITFYYGEYGKPSLIKNNKTLKFNVSHSKDMIVIALCNNYDIGVDIEYIKRDFDVFDIVENYFSKKEIKTLNSLPKPEQTAAFFRGWTRKEAFIKAKAKGLSFPLDSFSVSIDSDDKAELYETIWDVNEKASWNISPIIIAKDYKAAVAVKGKIKTSKHLRFKL